MLMPHVVKFCESPRFDIVVRRGKREHRIAKLIFREDGSIFVTCPSFPDTRGFVGIARLPAGGRTVSYRLRDFSLVTRHLVKYAHHTDGEAHFSQDGRVFTKVRRQSTPLDVMTGHLCSIFAAPVSEFPPPKGRDLKLIFVNPQTDSLEFRVARFRKSALGPFPAGDRTLTALVFADGVTYPGVFASPPKTFTHSAFYLFVSIAPRDTSAVAHCYLILGGFDSMETQNYQALGTEFLICMYPNTEIDNLERTLGSIDFTSHS